MTSSLFKRLYRVLFLVSLGSTLASLMALEFFNNDMEKTIIDLELAKEADYFKARINGSEYQSWRTARLEVLFIPQDKPDSLLPGHLQNIPTPYSGEIETGKKTFLVLAEKTENPAGNLLVVQDISVMEDQETLTQISLAIMASIMAAAGLIISRVAASYLTLPLKTLMRHIQSIEPGKSNHFHSHKFNDLEFVEIANAFNRLMEALERFNEREKSFVKLASHELRTPLAVMSGALDVIEMRGDLSATNLVTLARLRKAVDDMQQDVDTLLALTRDNSDKNLKQTVNIRQSILDTIEELESAGPEYQGRINLSPEGDDLTVKEDPSLIRMLARNLLLNTLKHTNGAVSIQITDNCLRIRDFGPGLPGPISARLKTPLASQKDIFQESNFGLLIVQLICEQIEAELVIRNPDDTGTEFLIVFKHEPKTTHL